MLLKKITCSLYFLSLFSISVFAHSNTKDSIQLTQWINQAFTLHRNLPDSALQIAEKGLQLAETVKDTQNQVNLWRIKGMVHYGTKDMKKALTCFETAYDLANKINFRKARLLINIGNVHFQQQAYQQALEKYTIAVEISQKKDTVEWMDALNNLGSVYVNSGKFDNAITYYEQCLILQKNIGNQKVQLPTYTNMGYVYSRMSQLNKSIETYKIGQELAEILKDTNWISIFYKRIGSIYKKQGADFESIQAYQKALTLLKLIDNKREVINTLSSIGIFYYTKGDYTLSLNYLKEALALTTNKINRIQGRILLFIGRCYAGQTLYDQALSNLYSAKAIYEQLGLSKSLRHPLYSLGNTYEQMNQLDSALYYLNQANAIAESVNENDEKAAVQISLGKVAIKKNEAQAAINAFKKAVIAAKTEGFIKKEIEATKLLAELLRQQNKTNEALTYLERYLILKDSLDSEENTKKIAQLEAEHAFEQEKQILLYKNEIEKQQLDNEIRQQRIWQIILGIALVLCLLALLFYVRFQRLNAKINAQKLKYEQKERERLEEVDTFKSRFFTNISHELRTPLTLILGPVQRLLKNAKLKENNQNLLQLIQGNANNLLTRVNEILDLAKLDSKALELKQRPTNFYDFINRLFANFEGYAQQKSQSLILNYKAPPFLEILLDQPKFEHIFNNYLSNAIKFTPEKGEITVHIYKEEKERFPNSTQLVLAVKDNGIGIQSKDLPHIFERFFQTEDSSQRYGGAGIGLALSKEMAHLMKGKVEVKSEYGKGSIFYFTMPYQELKKTATAPLTILETTENTVTKPIQIEEGGTSMEQAKETILIVEDNPQLRSYLALILSTSYQILTANNGKMALEKLADTECQLIISDIMMPIMDGFELLEKLKTSDKYCHLPIIMLTAKGQMHDKLHALRIGVDDYLLKPFVEEELLIRIWNLLTNKRNRHLPEITEDREMLPETAPISNMDLKWLEEVEVILQKELSNSNFTFEQLANQLFISRRQFQRRLKKITGLPPNKYFREIRLQSARALIESGEVRTISEVAYAVGFDTPKYFSKLYQDRFGKHPKTDL